MIQAPGSILQQMYLVERLRKLPQARFLEIGAGRGVVSKQLLDLGWSGVGYDLNQEAIEDCKFLAKEYIAQDRFEVRCFDWLQCTSTEKYDLIISCFVLEHLDEQDEERFLNKCLASLRPGGTVILMLPANPQKWSIEDDIAGHYRRYTAETLNQKLSTSGFHCHHLAGLNYPLSNILFPLISMVLKYYKVDKRSSDMSMNQRTVQSGKINVPLRTHFPSIFSLVLNRYVLSPFHWLQKLNRDNPECLVVYVEFTAKEKAAAGKLESRHNNLEDPIRI